MMDTSRQFLISSYLAAISGVFSLFVAGVLTLGLSSAFIVIGMLLFFAEGKAMQLSERLGTALAVLVVTAFLISWNQGWIGNGLFGNAPVGTFGFLIQAVSSIKLAQRKTSRDWVFIYLLAFFSVLLSAAIQISPSFLVVLSLNIGLTICSLFLLEMTRAESKVRSSSTPSNLAGRRVIGISTVITISIALISVPLFFALPRLGAAGLGEGLTGLNSQSGFSDSVRLGSIGRIQLSDSVVLRAKIEGATTTDPIRWRGVALDHFDNRSWSSSLRESGLRLNREKGPFLLKKPTEGARFILQNIYLEPIDADVLFMMSQPVALEGAFDSIEGNADESYRFRRRAFERLNYRVTSMAFDSNLDPLRNQKPQYALQYARYLRLPKDLDPRIAEFTNSLISEDSKPGILEVAKTVESHLRANYGYTLEQKSGGRQPLADFLFRTKEGHCEYFATAMAVMLRTQGIATRVVNGFQAGEYNPSTGFWIARQRDAHSWVEVFFPEANRWIAFDPTPPSNGENTTNQGLISGIRRFTDTLEILWIQYFVSYDESGQRSFVASALLGAKSLQSSANDGFEGIVEWFRNRFSQSLLLTEDPLRITSHWAPLVIIGTVVIFLFVGLLRLFRARAERKRIRIESKIFSDLLKILGRRNHFMGPGETPREFAKRTGIPEVVELIEIVYKVRFGNQVLDELTRGRIEELMRNLRTALHAS